MKKHSLIQVDFRSTVVLSAAESAKLKRWTKLAANVLEELILHRQIIHPSWYKDVTHIGVSLLLCGESRIKKLNREYRQKDKVTDVLSFPTFPTLRKVAPKHGPLMPDLYLGDLAICHQRAIKQARDFDVSYWDEFIHLFIHGMLHLLGYDHEVSAQEEKLMQKWENLALELFSETKKKGP